MRVINDLRGHQPTAGLRFYLSDYENIIFGTLRASSLFLFVECTVIIKMVVINL